MTLCFHARMTQKMRTTDECQIFKRGSASNHKQTKGAGSQLESTRQELFTTDDLIALESVKHSRVHTFSLSVEKIFSYVSRQDGFR